MERELNIYPLLITEFEDVYKVSDKIMGPKMKLKLVMIVSLAISLIPLSKSANLKISMTLSREDLLNLQDVTNSMLQQVIDVMDENQIEEINLWQEINVYDYKFCKQRFVFKICEMDSDGYVSNGELFQAICSMYQWYQC